jgi:hypothetical protein
LFGANYEHFKSSNLFFSGSNGVFIFNSLDEFYRAANAVALNGAPSVNNLLELNLDILLCQELLSHYKF